MRSLRRFLNVTLPMLGIVIILYALVVIPEIVPQLVGIALGTTIILVGTWNLYHAFFPNERQNLALRQEVDEFLDMVRQLNAMSASRLSDPEAIEMLVEAMHASVDRMRTVTCHQGADTDVEMKQTIA